MGFNRQKWVILGGATIVLVSVLIYFKGGVQPPASEGKSVIGPKVSGQTLQLTDAQMALVKVAPATLHPFLAQREAMGVIAFDDEQTVQVYPPYPGKILRGFKEEGDFVKKGETLYTLDSPDLIQAESTVIATAGVRELTTRVLERAKQLIALKGLAEKDYQQAISDQQTAEGNYNAARNALHLFGKSAQDIDRIEATHKVDSVLAIPSPLDGRVTVVAMSAAAGTYVQPGTAPAPYAISDLSTVWMLANVAETDIPLLEVGQSVLVRVMAFPQRTFQAKIDKVGTVVDPNTHRLQVRCVVRDPRHELHPGMMATFTIRTGADMQSVGLPDGGVVREGDGSYSAWVAEGQHRFRRRSVTLGVRQENLMQILEGIRPGENVATDGAIFLSNAFAVDASTGE
ncbi:efflux RND transporter periplasmic adaptor subunit [Ferrovum myxofaciens]|uniref:efflux RND transporter periplasmic adaptor subunit n=1 Tax=Ferrovum myxofaciens TaxID=416213 RepID=UPI002356CB8F|nr:efflux RND transporter periplasmic adaptor subunit [Ferrovum myxofaciens]MBU6994765.1 efflux RND transporter periplasmic adaptor subunit [Ferrovum myxofaciens]